MYVRNGSNKKGGNHEIVRENGALRRRPPGGLNEVGTQKALRGIWRARGQKGVDKMG